MEDFKPGDVVKIISKTSKNKDSIGFFLRYCGYHKPRTCCIQLDDGRTINIQETSIIRDDSVENKDISYGDFLDFYNKSNIGRYMYQYQREYIRRTCSGDGSALIHASPRNREVVTNYFKEYISYIYRQLEYIPRVTMSFAEAMGICV